MSPTTPLLALACALAGAAPHLTQDPTAVAAPQAAFDHTHALLTRVLAAHVEGDRVDYRALRADRSALDRYVASLERVGPSDLAGWTEEQRLAFWIDAYNAYTLRLVVDSYPVQSIKDIGSLLSSVWDKRFIPLAGLDPKGKGRKLSLNDIEHEILRKRFEDARVHAAINCASLGCPPLRPEAYVAERLSDQLDEQVRAWLSDPARNAIDPAKQDLALSKIFDWFAEDFVRDAGSVTAWVAAHLPPEIPSAWITAERVRVRYLPYDWRLNDVEREDTPGGGR